jgi:hypothetical protein
MVDWKADAEEALKALSDAAPLLVADVPQLAPLAPFLPLIGITLKGVSIVQTQTGGSTAEAVSAVAATLTPGMANAQALTAAAPHPQPTAAAAVTAAKAAAGAATLDDAAGHAPAGLRTLTAH